MPSVKLTDRWLKARQPEGRAREEWSDTVAPGLIVRLGPSGAVFYVRMREAGRYVRRRIGPYPSVSLFDARERAIRVVRARDRGDTASDGETFDRLAALYLKLHAKKNKRSWREDERMIEVDLLPAFSGRLASEIRPRDVARYLDTVLARGAPVLANRLRVLLSRIFRFGMARELVEINPAKMVDRPARETSRDLVLTEPQIVALWSVLEFKHPTLRHMLRTMLLSAVRPGEARLARWSELALDRWEIPGARTKNGKEHVIPVSPELAAVFEAQRALGLPGDWIFPAARLPNSPWSESGVDHAVRRFRSVIGCPMQPRDLRRTAATLLGQLGFRSVVPLVLNHSDGRVTAIYDRYAYLPEKREALEALGRHVHALLSQSRRPATNSAISERSQPIA